MSRRKKVLRGIGIAAAVVGVLLVVLLVYLTVNEYRPEAVEPLQAGQGILAGQDGMTLTVASLNTGYAALSKDADFFMDGGTGVQSKSLEQVVANMNGIVDMMLDIDADVYLLQEVDVDSDRSWNVDEAEVYEQQIGMPGIFAYNYKCSFVPYPVPMIGHVEAGLLTMTNLHVTEAERVALPNSFVWPVSTCNLKRCLLVERVPLEGTDKELVLVNLHLEAYDSGEGRIAQTKVLADVLESEYRKGNYVIAGGDFNQSFEGAAAYPVVDDAWVPISLAEADIPAGFQMVYSDSVPTTRVLSAPYTGSYDTTQVYVIDGFLVSDNVRVNDVKVLDYGFEYTDHQPVVLNATLEA